MSERNESLRLTLRVENADLQTIRSIRPGDGLAITGSIVVETSTPRQGITICGTWITLDWDIREWIRVAIIGKYMCRVSLRENGVIAQVWERNPQALVYQRSDIGKWREGTDAYIRRVGIAKSACSRIVRGQIIDDIQAHFGGKRNGHWLTLPPGVSQAQAFRYALGNEANLREIPG